MEKVKILNKRRIVVFIIYLVVSYGLLRYFVNNNELLDKMIHAPRYIVFICITTTIINIILNGFFDIVCAKVYGVNLKISDVIIFTFIATACNLILPLQIGSFIKAAYYKEKMHLKYSKYISIMSGMIVVSIVFYIAMLIVSLGLIMFEWNMDAQYIVTTVLLFWIGILLLYLILRFQKLILIILPFKKYSFSIVQGFFELMSCKRVVGLCFLIYLLLMIFSIIRFSAIFECLGKNVTTIYVFLYSSLYYTSNILPILPGNIGISEVIMGITNNMLASDFDTGINVVLITRLYYYVVVGMGVTCLAIPAWIKYKHIKDNTIGK